MTAQISVQVKPDQRLLRQLDPNAALRAMGRGLYLGASGVQKELIKTPRKAAGAFSALATVRQKRAVWAKYNAGLIDFNANGYKRTGKTNERWTVKGPDVLGHRVSVTIGNNAPGARWLYGRTTQQPFHAISGWPRVDEAAKKYERRIIRAVNAELKRELQIT